ncbi:hypothetical protein SDRG_04119 [Saprolegnia diclina VS20]|uniref:Peptidase M14 domain-containing protein n=1 Tax=Saprolegnia diclina (strain VS20) TaxID=1156394 RepID=T0S0F2_SAPDV|nr:hypothetical protein SDRG_04119 [Saprolegnia diclina VS20]EQC38408.1 hypothetical protein SDRG_04119 [Saprolegnia diclina VS20]|eukprot:XP_008608000.1 hypothetical protein SDRG_04119 [Saprolegnia diclina VS20]
MEVPSSPKPSPRLSLPRAKLKSLLALSSLAPLPLIQAHHESINDNDAHVAKAEFNTVLPHVVHKDIFAASAEGSPIGSEDESRQLAHLLAEFERRFWKKANKKATSSLVFRRRSLDPTHVATDEAPVVDPTSLTFDSNFESANLASAYRVHDRNYSFVSQCTSKHGDTAGPSRVDQEYDLYCTNDTYTLGHIQWYYFKVTRPPGNGRLRVRFNLRNMMKRDSLYNCGMLPAVYSEAKVNAGIAGWTHGGEEAFYYQNADVYTRVRRGLRRNFSHYTLSFIYTFEPSEDVVYFAHCFPYTYTYLQTYLTSLEKCPLRSRNLRRRTLCSTLCGNACDMLTITEFTSEPQVLRKRTGVVLTARVHPGETNGSFLLHGIMEFLTGFSDEAIALRKCYIFKIIPMLNPDGVVHGNYRCSLAGIDLNRRWSQPSELYHPTIYAAKKMIALMRQSRKVLLFCDFHGHSRKKNMFTYIAIKMTILSVTDRNRYGCKPYLSWSRLEDAKVRLFPYVLCKTSSAQAGGYFSFTDCTFNVTRSKRSTGRVAVWSDIQILNSITLEASFCGTGDNKARRSIAAFATTTPNHTPRHFTQRDFTCSGEQFCHALTTYGALLGIEPIDATTLLGASAAKHEGVLELLDLDETPIEPNVRDPTLLTSTTAFGANDFAYSETALSLLDEIASCVPSPSDGAAESENSSGSDSNPSEDNYEPEELESNTAWQAFRRNVVLRRSSSALKSASAGPNSGRTASLTLSSSLAKKSIKLRKKVRRSSTTGTPRVTVSDAPAVVAKADGGPHRSPRVAPLPLRRVEVKNAGGFAQFHKNMIQRRIHQSQIVMRPPP